MALASRKERSNNLVNPTTQTNELIISFRSKQGISMECVLYNYRVSNDTRESTGRQRMNWKVNTVVSENHEVHSHLVGSRPMMIPTEIETKVKTHSCDI
jgi:hypothetical protein